MKVIRNGLVLSAMLSAALVVLVFGLKLFASEQLRSFSSAWNANNWILAVILLIGTGFGFAGLNHLVDREKKRAGDQGAGGQDKTR